MSASTEHQISVDGHDSSFSCRDGHAVLFEMGRAGVRPISAGCHGGGCGTCRVAVITGQYFCGKMSRAHVSEDDEREGIVLACQLFPLSDLELRSATRSRV